MSGQPSSEHVFHRPPRAYPPAVPAEQVRIAAPPHAQSGQRESWLYVLFPVVGSATLFAYAVIYKNPLFFWIAGLLVVVTLSFALALRWSQKRTGRKNSRRQRRRYREHLAEREQLLGGVARMQLQAADRLYPDPPRLWGIVLRREGLWERRRSDDDALEIRVGRGPVPHASKPTLELGLNPVAEHEDGLVDEARAVEEKWKTLRRAPVTIDLAREPVLSVAGDRAAARGLARTIAAQLSTGRAPTDLRLGIAYDGLDGDADEAWSWAKWLPHTRTGAHAAAAGPAATIATSYEALADLLDDLVAPRVEQLRTLRAARAGLQTNDERIDTPFIVLVIDGYEPLGPAARLPLLREAMHHGAALRVAVICLVDDPADEPSDADASLRLATRGTATLVHAGPGGDTVDEIEPDELATGAAEALARALAPIQLGDGGEDAGRAGRDLVGLLGLPSLAAVDPETEWRPRPRSLALRVPIGLTEDGHPLELDLKQAAEGGMGPHGLIIGATGSGKSELLRTLLSGLAITHSPDDLAFVLVDWKGGATFNELAGLPHTAGMITDLQRDRSLVDRMHDALVGERERRQSLLRDAGNLDDVLAYRRLREQDPTLEPLPDLLVLIDEFGELLAARPDFIDLFVQIGRVGRALGIHLLFASQRFDEGRLRGLESTLRYRVCLRTETAPESKAVLGTPDAALLPPEPGLGFLKVDSSLYERFDAALVTTPEPAEAGGTGVVVEFGAAAGAASRTSRDEHAAAAVETRDAVAAGIRHLVRTLQGGADRVHQIWLEPLPHALSLDAVPEAVAGQGDGSALRAALGLVDLPLQQRRGRLQLDFGGGAGHLAIVGAPQTGKSAALRTLILGLARDHGPRDVQFSAIDLGGGGLRSVADLPHVSAVAGKSDRELVRQIVRRLRAELALRETRFSELGLDDMPAARRRRAAGASPDDGGFPDLFLVVDGWAQLRRDFLDLDLDIEELANTGLAYGIHVILSAARWAEMRPSLQDNIGGRIELRLNDAIESEIDRRANEALPKDVPGRGLLPGSIELQLALPRLDGAASADGLRDASVAATREIAQRWTEQPAAPQIRTLPRRLRAADVAPVEEAAGRLVLGIDEDGAAPVTVDLLGADTHLLVLGDGESGRTNLLRHAAQTLSGGPDAGAVRLWIVDPRRTLDDIAELPNVAAHATTSMAITQLATDLADRVRQRLAADGAARTGEGDDAVRDVLLVDDFDLIAGPEGNPLAALASAVAHGRDAGLHVVLARRLTGVTRGMFEPLFQRLYDLRPPGLMLSGDPAEGPVLGGRRPEPLPAGRALFVRRGATPISIQTIHTDPRPTEFASVGAHAEAQ